MTVNDAYWAHITGTAACNQSCLTAWQHAKTRQPSIELLPGDGSRVITDTTRRRP